MRTVVLRRALIGVVMAVGVMACLGVAILPGMYRYLDVTSRPQRADVIVVLSGAADRRIRTAMTLFRAGVAPRMIISCHPAECDYIKDKGVIPPDLPPDRVQWVIEPRSTWDEAGKLVQLLRTLKVRSAVIVTDISHTRRARAVFQLRAGSAPFEMTFAGADVPGLTVDAWWQQGYPRALVFTEYGKLIMYWLQYGIDVR